MIIDGTLTESDFDACFAGEPDPVEPLADLRRGRLRRRRRRTALVGVPAVAALAGLATVLVPQPAGVTPAAPVSAVPKPTPSNDSPDNLDYRLPPDSARRIEYGSVFSDPPAGQATAHITAAQALRTTQHEWGGFEPAVALRLVSSSSAEANADGVNSTPHLYWVVVWKGDLTPIHFPVAVSSDAEAANEESERRYRATGECWYHMFVDARTGRSTTVGSLCTTR